jgi:hypothetical protein
MADGVTKSRNFAISTVFGRLACCKCVHYSTKTVALILKAILYLSEYLYAGSNLYTVQSGYLAERQCLNMRNTLDLALTLCVCVHVRVCVWHAISLVLYVQYMYCVACDKLNKVVITQFEQLSFVFVCVCVVSFLICRLTCIGDIKVTYDNHWSPDIPKQVHVPVCAVCKCELYY